MANTTTTPTISVTITKEIDLDSISSLLCSAFEGGSNYWYEIDQYVAPATFTYLTEAGDCDEGETPQVFKHIDYPLNEGGAVIISVPEDDDGKTYTLDLKAIKKGLRIMAKDYPRHFTDFVKENDDACTGDVFLQCCLFGEVIFG